MFTRKQKVRRPTVPTPNTGIKPRAGATVATKAIHHQEVPMQSVKLDIDALFTLTAASGGAADAQGLKILTLPAGRKLVAATVVENLVVTTPAGCSVATAVWSIGTAAAADANGALTSTEADLVASTTLGDGTLAAGASETEPTTTTPGQAGTVGLIAGSAAAEIDVYLNIGGTFTHATDVLVDIGITGQVELFFMDLGAAA